MILWRVRIISQVSEDKSSLLPYSFLHTHFFPLSGTSKTKDFFWGQIWSFSIVFEKLATNLKMFLQACFVENPLDTAGINGWNSRPAFRVIEKRRNLECATLHCWEWENHFCAMACRQYALEQRVVFCSKRRARKLASKATKVFNELMLLRGGSGISVCVLTRTHHF